MKITLYKQDKKNRIQEWSVETESNKFRTIEGFVDGKLTISEWTECFSKNVGKKHETSPVQQAENEALSKARKKKENGYFENISDSAQGSGYIEPMLAHKFVDYGEKILNNYETFSQPKLDGIRCIATREGLFTRKGKPIVAVPHIIESVMAILNEKPEIIALDGELYNHELKHDFNKITSLVKRIHMSADDLKQSEQLAQYHVYDIIVLDATFAERNDIIEHYHGFPYIHIVKTEKVSNRACLDILYENYLKDGYEGQMIRIAESKYEFARTKSLLKRKEFVDVECKVINIIEGSGNRSGMAGSVTCIHPNGETFDAGIKGGFDFYRELLINKTNYIGKQATIKYQNLTPDGKPRFANLVSFRDYE